MCEYATLCNSTSPKGVLAHMSAMMMEQDQELTLDEVARRLGISYDTVLRRVRTKRIRARKEGQKWRVRESDLQAYIESTYRWSREAEDQREE